MPEQPSQPAHGQPGASILSGLNPDELFARGMQSVKMTGAGGLTTWEPPSVAEAARLFPNYEVMELVGRGGMGAVYKARQLALDRFVAIKLLPLEVSVDRDFAERFKREARTMARMNHPHIVSVFDFGTTTEGHLFFVMEYVEGTTLHHIIKTTGLMPPQALEIIVGVCEALAYAHVEGVVHRDIKPANVLVDVRGRVKVTDFGLARLNTSAAEQNGYTMTGTVLGTPDYMAPEQKRGMRVDHRADIYSLGVMLYEMLCGQVPQGIFDPPSMRVGVDERVDQVVIRAMQQEPDRRYQNTAEMKHEVQTIRLSHDPNARAPQPRKAPPIGGVPPKKTSPLLMVLVGVLLAAGVTWGLMLWNKNNPPTPDGRGLIADNPSKRPETPSKLGSTPAPAIPPVNIASTQPPANPPTPPGTGSNPSPTPTPTPPLVATTTGNPNTGNPPSPGVGTTGPTTSLIGANSNPPARPDLGPGRSVSNPDMANAVANIPPPRAIITAPPVPPVITEPWRESVEQGDALLKERDPDGAVQAYERAVDQAERATPAASPLEIARIHQKMGNLAALRNSPAEAKGNFEDARRALQRMKGKSAEATQMLNEIDTIMRRLPRE